MKFRPVKLIGISTLLLLFAQFNSPVSAQVVINEFMALNATAFPDMWDFDDFSDWIELYNTSDADVSLKGYYLSDKIKNYKKWAFPDSAKISAKGFIVVRADGNNATPGTAEIRNSYDWNDPYVTKYYHTNFKLSDLSEELGLFKITGAATDSIPVDAVYFSRQLQDVSLGRNPSDNMKWYKYDSPTPGAANTTPGKPLEILTASPSVVFSMPGGFYPATQSITLSLPAGTPATTQIYYTTNGSIPYATSSKYSSPIAVNASTVIRARCIDPNYIAGAVGTNTYFINEDPRTLMSVAISTDSTFLFSKDIGVFENSLKGREVPVSIEFFTPEGAQVVKVRAGITIGSLTNFTCKQKPMQLALKGGKYGDDFIWYQLFAKRAACFPKLRFRQGGDAWKTNLIADGMLESIVNGQLELGMQAYRPVIAFINGQYYGLQDMREQFDDQFFTNNYNLDPTSKEEVRSTFLPVPGKTVEGWELVSGTWDNYNALISFVKTGPMTDQSKYEQVKSQVNINSFVDFISAIVFGNQISWGHNEDLWKTATTKWQWLITDYDRALMYKQEEADVSHNMFTTPAGVSGALMDQNTLFKNLITNTEFKNYFTQRLAAHLSSTFLPKRMNNIVDSLQGLLSSQMAKYINKWGPQGGVKSIAFWNSELDSIRMFNNERGGYILQHLQAAPFNMSVPAKLTVALSTPKPGEIAGEIFINEVRMSQGLDTMKFFKNAPFLVKAVANPGFVFTGWKGRSNTADTMTVTLTGDDTMTANFEVSQEHPLTLSITKDTTLSLTDKPYIASGDVEVARGATLTIEKGVTIAMAEGAGIYVKGRMLVNGTAESPVKIMSNEAAGVVNWAAICFDTAQDTNRLTYLTLTGPSIGRDALNQRAAINGNATPKIIIDHLYMPDSDYPMYFEGCDVALSNAKIIINHICNGGIHVGRGPCLVENSTWISTGKTMNSDGIDIKGTVNAVIRNNRLYNFNGFNSDGIDLGEKAIGTLIEGNYIFGNRDKGVSCGGKSTCIMRNNIIVECDMGIGIKDDGSYATLDHNTFIRCNKTVNVYEKSYTRGGGVSTVTNNIFSGSKIASVMFDRNSSVVASYNFSDMDYIPGDHNYFGSPRFVELLKNNFQLSETSPCIGTGDPAGPTYLKGWKNIGANYTFSENDFPADLTAQFANSIVINEIMYKDNKAVGSKDWVELHNPTSKEIDISGWQLTDHDLPDPVTWIDVPSLDYVYSAYNDKDTSHLFKVPAGTKIAAGGFLVLCKSPKSFNAAYPGVSNFMADSLRFGLNGSGRLALYSNNDSLVAFVTPNNKAPWPVDASGTGMSLELRNPNFWNYYTLNWGASSTIGGTPGKQNSIFNTFVINNKNIALPDRFFLAQNCPNPCKGKTNIVFSLPFKDHVQLAIYSLSGRKLETLMDSEMKAGVHSIAWDARKYSSGVYLYRMKTSSFTRIMKASVR